MDIKVWTTLFNLEVIHRCKKWLLSQVKTWLPLKLQENLKKSEKLVAEREKLQKALESAKEDHSQISEQNQVWGY